MSVTVQELLALPSMQGVKVLAGSQGLRKQVRWVHVSELLDISRLLKGGELLLTTGLGLLVTPEQQAQFIYDLAEHGVAALAIELVRWVQQVPPAMAEAAEQAGLPLLAWGREVPFVQITEEVHSLIVNRHYAQLRRAEAVARRLSEIALQNKGIETMLRALHGVLRNPVACVPAGSPLPGAEPEAAVYRMLSYPPVDRMLAYPPVDRMLAYPPGERMPSYPPVDRMLAYPPGDWASDLQAGLGATGAPQAGAPATVRCQIGRRVVDVWLQPILVAGRCWGHLAVVRAHRELDEVDRLVIDRAAVTLAYEVLRHQTLQEQQRASRADLLESILAGRTQDAEALQRRAQALGYELAGLWLTAGVAQVPPGADRQALQLRIEAECRRRSLTCLITWHPGELCFLLGTRSRVRLAEHLIELARDLESSAGAGIRFGYGRPFEDLRAAAAALHQARYTAHLRQLYRRHDPGPLFDATGIHGLLLAGASRDELIRFARHELGPLLQRGAEGETALRTLRALLDNSLSVADAARALQVSRQTIYLRRTLIEAALGYSLDHPERRLSLALALRVLEFEQLLGSLGGGL